MFDRKSISLAYVEVYDACQLKANRGPLAGIVVALAVLVLIVAAQFDWPAHLRGMMISYWAVSIGLAGAVFAEKRAALKRAYQVSKPQGELELAKMKFGSEIAAGFALVALAGPLIQLSSTLEQGPPYDRLSRFDKISDQITMASGCLQSPGMLKCTAIKDQLAALHNSIERKAESTVVSQTDRLSWLLQHAFLKGVNQHDRPKLIEASEKLLTLQRNNDWLSQLAPLLPIVSMLCGAIAVSSKIAVAWHDKESKSKAASGSGNNGDEQVDRADRQQDGALHNGGPSPGQ